MADYVNPTGTIAGTSGDDSIIFNIVPIGQVTAIDAIGGYDSLTIQIDSPTAESFIVSDQYNSGEFYVDASLGVYQPQIIGYNVENVTLAGTASNDSFSLLHRARVHVQDPFM